MKVQVQNSSIENLEFLNAAFFDRWHLIDIGCAKMSTVKSKEENEKPNKLFAI